MSYQKGGWSGGQTSEPTYGLNQYELKEMTIVKQALIKSMIEGGILNYETNHKTAEAFIEGWIEYIYRNTDKEKTLTKGDVPF